MSGEQNEIVASAAPYGAGTRRAFLGGATVLGFAGVVAGPLSASADSAEQPCLPDPEGIPAAALAATPDGRTIWTADIAAGTVTAHGARRLARGRSIEVGGAPVDIAISPRGGLALVTTGFWDRPGLAFADLHTREVERREVGPEPHTVAFSPSGRSAYVTGGATNGTLTRIDIAARRVDAPVPVGAHPRGVAVLPGGKRALVALNGAAQLVVVDLEHGRVVRRISTGPFPDRLAVSPDGSRALVTHSGFRAGAATFVELTGKRRRRRLRTGLDPAGVDFSPSGRTVLVTAAGAGTLSIFDARTGRLRRSVRRAGTPGPVVVAGGRGVVADGRSGKLSAVRIGVA